MVRDDSSLRRQLTLLRTLTSRHYGLTVRAMAAEAGVNEKTIRRDLDLFRSLGCPLEETVGEFGRKTWTLKGGWNPPPLSFTFDEAAALYLARRSLDPLAGTFIWHAAQSAFRKIRASLTQKVLDYLDRSRHHIHFTTFGASDYSEHGDAIDAILQGCEECKAIHILYQSDNATEPADRDVYPYGMSWHRSSLYLIALDPREDKIKHYKIDRIENVEVSTFPFQKPKDFDAQAHLASAFGIYQGEDDITVKIRFAPAVARYVQEGRWHASQKLTKQRDGSLLAEFRLSSTKEIKSWVLGFGHKAVVLEPEELRQEIVEELQTLLELYTSAVPGRRPSRATLSEAATSPLPLSRGDLS